MAQQHYDGKKHKKNAARADLLEQLGKTLDVGEMKGTESLSCHHACLLDCFIALQVFAVNDNDDDNDHRCDIVKM